jgi:ABC-type bacteriocin/lantibiotic exporter with double-glycine peptidase domain
MPPTPAPKKKVRWSAAWAEARQLIWARRWRLALGLILMIVNTLAGLVLPYTTKSFIDDVVTKGNFELLTRLAFMVGAAALVYTGTSFAV